MIKIEVRDLGENVKLASLAGELDNTTLVQAEKIIDPLILGMASSFLLLDLSQLTYLNSSGLAKLLQYHLHLNVRSGGLKIFGLSRLIYEIMEVCGALRILEVYENQEKAMRSLNLF